MSRKGPAPKRVVLPDPKYKNVKLSKFMNMLMKGGKKSLAERIVYGAMDTISQKTGKDPLSVFQEAMDNATPLIEVRPRRVGGATYQVPVEVRTERRNSLAMRWLISAARARSGRTMTERLANELIDASAGIGSAVKKKEDTHRMAEANKAFAHYRW
ncbi:MAG: 30S ribosomal protein S7 [Vulcanimicrobiota bacterium]